MMARLGRPRHLALVWRRSDLGATYWGPVAGFPALPVVSPKVDTENCPYTVGVLVNIIKLLDYLSRPG